MDVVNILVSVDHGEAAPDRIRLAADVARRFNAILTGVAARAVPVPLFVLDIYDAAAQEERNIAETHRILDAARASFARSTGTGTRTDWREALAGPVTYLVERAREADLVVVGRRGPGDEDPGPLGVPPGPVLMEAGRPVLVVPPRVQSLTGTRIVVAWKDAPEARRAVSAALPFIRTADHVFVVSAGGDTMRDGTGEVAGYLTRHGAQVTTQMLEGTGSACGAILDYALLQDADLLVMGAYGHSRLREWIFGGVTREALDHAPISCLMCH
ncbi:MAG: universal stress protein [Parafilimonas terrae]|nr:universal stress protein [Parafilimonas terrae]